MKTIIIFYSRNGENSVSGNICNLIKGNANVIAEYIHNDIESNLYEITSDREYSLDYIQCAKEAEADLENDIIPNLTSKDLDVSGYKNIFLVYPNWWSEIPMPVKAFLLKYDLSKKNIFPVCTHEGSGFGDSLKTIKKLQPNSTVVSSKDIKGSTAPNSQGIIKEWLETIELEK